MSALYISQNNNTSRNNNFQNKTFRNNNPAQQADRGNRKELFCHYCKMPGHTRDFCYKLNGYPPRHKLNTRSNTNNIAPRGNKVVNNITFSDDVFTGQSHCVEETVSGQDLQLGSLKINQKQMNKLMAMLDIPDFVANHVAGTRFSSTHKNNIKWLIDSGATNHITP